MAKNNVFKKTTRAEDLNDLIILIWFKKNSKLSVDSLKKTK